VESLGAFRFTVTFPVINNASNIIFLASGEKKAQAVAAVLEGDFDPGEYPAQNVKAVNGNVYWFIDEPASALLAAP
jgi:6-phosphogluconolactonase